MICTELDILFKGATIYDGLGNRPFTGNIGVSSGFIVYPAENSMGKSARRVIDSENLCLCPGFINIHSHSDMPLLVDGRVPSVIHQGITTEVTGNCGYSLAPLYGSSLDEIRREFKRDFDMDVTWNDFNEYFNLLERQGVSVNVISLVGHGTLRGSVTDRCDRSLTKDEMAGMKEELYRAMKQGAAGLSTGLIYPPGSYAPTEELIDLGKTLGETGGFYASHIRGEGDTLFDAVKEAITIGMETGIPVEISHLKAAGEKNWGKTAQVLEMIGDARSKGLYIQHDQYPYTASATGLSMMVPDWAHDGGTYAFLCRLNNEDIRKKILEEMNYRGYINGRKVLISCVNMEKNKKYEGRDIYEIAGEEEKNVFEFILDLLFEEEGSVGAIYMSMDEEDVRRVMKDSFTSIGNDASASATEGPLFRGKPHPRTYGTFPRVLGKYSRDEGLFPLEEGIRKMTSLPARMLGLADRGIIKHGMAADLIVFDRNTIEDRGTYKDPHKYPDGIEYVIVNGLVILDRGEISFDKAGKVLRKS
ncbi:MAG: D-aminoacylase [Candidatus Eremiobacterota bacterium]